MPLVRQCVGFMIALAFLSPGVAVAQDATPVVDDGRTVFTLVERPEQETQIDNGEPGPGPGDLLVWGPNPLYNEANEEDSGAVTYGSCIALNVAGDNHCMETIQFPDGSTLEIQGLQQVSGAFTRTTIIGGSGTYRGATGTLTAGMSDDGETWIKDFEVFLPDDDQV